MVNTRADQFGAVQEKISKTFFFVFFGIYSGAKNSSRGTIFYAAPKAPEKNWVGLRGEGPVLENRLSHNFQRMITLDSKRVKNGENWQKFVFSDGHDRHQGSTDGDAH